MRRCCTTTPPSQQQSGTNLTLGKEGGGCEEILRFDVMTCPQPHCGTDPEGCPSPLPTTHCGGGVALVRPGSRDVGLAIAERDHNWKLQGGRNHHHHQYHHYHHLLHSLWQMRASSQTSEGTEHQQHAAHSRLLVVGRIGGSGRCKVGLVGG